MSIWNSFTLQWCWWYNLFLHPRICCQCCCFHLQSQWNWTRVICYLFFFTGFSIAHCPLQIVLTKRTSTVLCWNKFCPFWNLLFLPVDFGWSVPLGIKIQRKVSFSWPATASSISWLLTVLLAFLPWICVFCCHLWKCPHLLVEFENNLLTCSVTHHMFPFIFSSPRVVCLFNVCAIGWEPCNNSI